MMKLVGIKSIVKQKKEEVPPSLNFAEIKAFQKATLSSLQDDAQAKLEEWNFECVEVVSYKQLRNDFHLSEVEARGADYLILYHKKIG